MTPAGANGAPSSWAVESPVDFIIGFTYQASNGFFIGWGASFGLNTTNRSDVPGASFTTEKKFDRWGNQVRIGWHPGVRVYVAPAPPPPPPPPPPPAQVNRPPTVKARCEPCVVEVGPHLNGHRRRIGSGRRRARLQVERALGHLRQPGRAADNLHLPDRRPARCRSR